MKYFVWRRIWQIEVEQVTLIQYVVCYLHAQNYNAKHHMDHSEAGQSLSLRKT
jgi:hypothetical protein